ncbi:MAG: hypothetical protein IJD75_08235 [Clostridia bacterium]|nr:hypothetical protein [Clostridia bacterium]
MGGLLDYLRDLSAKDVYQVLTDCNGMVADWADSLGVSAVIFFAVGLAVALVLGFGGYKLVKLVAALTFGGVGYCVGEALFGFFKEQADWLPEWGVYLVGGVVALAFLCMAFSKFSYALFTMFAFAGYFITSFYFNDAMIAFGGAILLAMLSVIFLRWVYILTSSFLCGFFGISFLSQILPDVELLQMEEGNWFSLCCAVALMLVFAVCQLVVTRKAKRKGHVEA